jgi:hypothetical protein
MRPAATYRGARRNEAKRARKGLKARTVGAAMLSYAEILRVNQMHGARIRQEQQQQKAA